MARQIDPHPLTFTHERTGCCVVFSLSGDLLGEQEAQTLVGTAEAYAHQPDAPKGCLLDISGVHYMNSTGLSRLIQIVNIFGDAGGRAVVAAPTRPVARILAITKLDTIFQMADSRAAGLQQLGCS